MHKNEKGTLLYDNDEERKAAGKYNSIKSRLKNKGKSLDWEKEDFINWYKKQPKKCYYCGNSEKTIEQFYEKTKSKNKRPTRGKVLEIDRKFDENGYSQENCVLACAWCNNAKTDVFNAEEFKQIGKAIGKVIREFES